MQVAAGAATTHKGLVLFFRHEERPARGDTMVLWQIPLRHIQSVGGSQHTRTLEDL